jgi:C-terminal processing protease CtpA/Prc
MSDEAGAYLSAAIDIMEARSLNTREVDWTMVRADAWELARGAKTAAATYDAVRFALRALADQHSGFIEAEMMSSIEQVAAAASGEPYGEMLAGNIGYLQVPGFASFEQDVIEAFATRLQQIIREVDRDRPCGWVVDLREDGGGNMWAMLAGLGPILGDGEMGGRLDNAGERRVWSYVDGGARNGSAVLVRVTAPAYRLHAPSPPVAVLIGEATSSSGEAVAVAFQGRARTRTFGQPSRGLTTGNRPFFLSDGALLNLTTTVYVDRLGKTYGGPVQPDQTVAGPAESGLRAAESWLLTQPACR